MMIFIFGHNMPTHWSTPTRVQECVAYVLTQILGEINYRQRGF